MKPPSPFNALSHPLITLSPSQTTTNHLKKNAIFVKGKKKVRLPAQSIKPSFVSINSSIHQSIKPGNFQKYQYFDLSSFISHLLSFIFYPFPSFSTPLISTSSNLSTILYTTYKTRILNTTTTITQSSNRSIIRPSCKLFLHSR